MSALTRLAAPLRGEADRERGIGFALNPYTRAKQRRQWEQGWRRKHLATVGGRESASEARRYIDGEN